MLNRPIILQIILRAVKNVSTTFSILIKHCFFSWVWGVGGGAGSCVCMCVWFCFFLQREKKHFFSRCSPFILVFPKASWLYAIMTWQLTDTCTVWLFQLLLCQSLMLSHLGPEKSKVCLSTSRATFVVETDVKELFSPSRTPLVSLIALF